MGTSAREKAPEKARESVPSGRGRRLSENADADRSEEQVN
ncbi:hypothetical protein CSB93_1370 [Pseudomonas paraeruginosa]|uniref:Uncharacterized protein n=1 Tax=Pseudomonas paraeruginosa TaxID=2994495 RepID=A0A2R3IYA7_9PSED|nr:hypothetical protein CSB93_1370 [Pseudomonas paraeruginosa]AWE95122.1 hypothetical protein CSC28_0140 [Pseudomonas paraeruginosa]PTC39171.1 hypothetical protein CLJ1_0114 [Pseudomonas aeruginosa]